MKEGWEVATQVIPWTARLMIARWANLVDSVTELKRSEQSQLDLAKKRLNLGTFPEDLAMTNVCDIVRQDGKSFRAPAGAVWWFYNEM